MAWHCLLSVIEFSDFYPMIFILLIYLRTWHTVNSRRKNVLLHSNSNSIENNNNDWKIDYSKI